MNQKRVENVVDMSAEDFYYTKSLEKILPSGNKVVIPFDVEKIINRFEKKILKKSRENKEYSEEFKEILEIDLEVAWDEIVEQLQILYDYKIMTLDGKVLLEYCTKPPLTLVEKMRTQAVIDNYVKEVFGNYVEELSDLLMITWLRIEEDAFDELERKEKERKVKNESKS